MNKTQKLQTLTGNEEEKVDVKHFLINQCWSAFAQVSAKQTPISIVVLIYLNKIMPLLQDHGSAKWSSVGLELQLFFWP